MTNENVISTNSVSKKFNGSVAVEGITLDVQRGTIFGFIGPSGCGKTTTIRLLVGTYEPTDGEISVLGRAPASFGRPEQERIGYMPQLFVLYPELTVWENLQFAASLYGVPFRRKERLEELLDLVELKGHEDKLVRNISGGMQRRLSLAAALVHDPEIIFLDEPTAGIDPILRRKLWDHFRTLRDSGHTLFVTTQYVNEAESCDQVGLMADGHLIAVDSPDGLRRRALGGDIIQIRFAQPFAYNLLHDLRQEEYVNGLKSLDRQTVQLIVEDADHTLPFVINWCDDRQIDVEAAIKYLPPYDDIFVKLIQDHKQEEPSELPENA